MHALRRDAAYALRSWRRRPAAIAAALFALSLGIGANTTIFSVVSGVLIKPLPYSEPDRLVMVWRDMRARGGPEREWSSPGHVIDWQRRGDMFEHVAGVRGWAPNLTGDGEPERLRGAAVSRAYFLALGVQPLHGRFFTPEEDMPGSEPSAIISHALWVRRFGSAPDIVGRTVALDGQPTTVLGVMPASFRSAVMDAELWSPLRLNPAAAPRGMIVLRVLAKLAPGVTLEQAQAQLPALMLADAGQDPEEEGTRLSLVRLHEDMVGPVRPVLIILSGAVILVLLIACANVASLLLARATERSREITIRLALGAGRGDIVRQLLTESLILGIVGGILGVLLAWWGLQGLLAIAPPAAPRLQDVRLDITVLAFAAAIALLSALLAGLVPALITARTTLTPALRDGGREATSGTRTRSALVILEVTLAMMLVAGAGLLVRSLISLQRTDLGFNPRNVLTASVSPPRSAYRNDEELRILYGQLLERAALIPGIKSAAVASVLPLSNINTDFTFEILGRPRESGPAGQPSAWFRVVSPAYFQAMGVTLVEGRGLSDEDTADAPGAVVINESLARKYWNGASPLGARLLVEGTDSIVVGVARDMRHRGPTQPADGEMFLSYLQARNRAAFLVLRTEGDPVNAAAALRAAVRSVDPNLPAANIATMEQLLERTLAQPKFLAALLTGFSTLAALLAVVGVYSVLSFSVSRRVREIGVRLALGADRATVVRLVLRQSFVLVGSGLALGTVLAALLSRTMTTLLHGVAPGDPATLAGMALLIAAAGFIASCAPARRASLVDPVVALRDE